MRRTGLAALCLAAAATAGLTTGCLPGQDSADSKPKGPFAGLSGGQITERALKATTSAPSVRLKGRIHDDESKGTVDIDMALNGKGECAGTLSMDGQGKADLVRAGSSVYMKYDEKFLRAQSEGESKEDTDAAVDMLAGKWTKMAMKGQDAKDLASFCDLNTVLGDISDGESTGTTRGRTTRIDGTPAIALHEKDGKDRYTAYVATEGKPYLLRIDTASGAKEPEHLSFTEYGKPVPAQKPAGKIIDLDAL
ncbi:lipoprotein [Streptomyces libani subsp. rufus]|nr:lipoprotein [Streptomyces libani subsp. rufus]